MPEEGSEPPRWGKFRKGGGTECLSTEVRRGLKPSPGFAVRRSRGAGHSCAGGGLGCKPSGCKPSEPVQEKLQPQHTEKILWHLL